MLYPLSYRGGAASRQRAAVRTISVRSNEDRRPSTDLAFVELTRSVPTTDFGETTLTATTSSRHANASYTRSMITSAASITMTRTMNGSRPPNSTLLGATRWTGPATPSRRNCGADRSVLGRNCEQGERSSFSR